MADHLLTGTRVRNRRLDRGLRQTDLAQRVGISGSYLNLIEHNKRRIGGRLLAKLAHALEIDTALLEDETSASILAPLSEAAAAFPQADADAKSAEEFVARFPAWASVIAAQQARIDQLQRRVTTLGNRLAHDTQMATSLHEVISTATSIRSTASILAETPDLEADWQARFHGNIDRDAARLADSSQALLGLLDIEAGAPQGPAEDAAPEEQAEAIMAARGFVLDEVEEGQTPDWPEGTGDAARHILDRWANTCARDAAALPLDVFIAAALQVAFDPARLTAWFSEPLDRILRRLAQIPPAPDVPQMGLAMCDAAGVVTYQRPVLDFRLPRSGAACPLWPLYQALSQPGRPLRRVLRLPGPARTAFDCVAIATLSGQVAFDDVPRVTAVMLVRPAAASAGAPGAVGPGCRVCPIEGCDSRRQPHVL